MPLKSTFSDKPHVAFKSTFTDKQHLASSFTCAFEATFTDKQHVPLKSKFTDKQRLALNVRRGVVQGLPHIFFYKCGYYVAFMRTHVGRHARARLQDIRHMLLYYYSESDRRTCDF